VWVLLSGAHEPGSAGPLPLDLGLFDEATGAPRGRVWLLLGVLCDACLAACLTMVAHELAQWRAWRVTARRAIARVGEPASPPCLDPASHASAAGSWPQWRVSAAGAELAAAASQPFSPVGAVPRWWLAREHTWGPLLPGLLVALHPALLAGATVGGQGRLPELALAASLLQLLRGRATVSAAMAGALVVVSPAHAAIAGLAAACWRPRGGSALRAAAAWLAAAASAAALCAGPAPASTARLLLRYALAPSAAASASPLQALALYALPEMGKYLAAVALLLPAALLALVWASALPRRAAPAPRTAAPSLAEAPVEVLTAALGCAAALAALAPDTSVTAQALALALLASDTRVLSLWDGAPAPAVVLHVAWALLVASSRAAAVGLGEPGNPNLVLAEQLVATACMGMVVVSWARRAAVLGRGLELAEAALRLAETKAAE